MDYLNYKNKVCVITGASSGVGRDLADMLMDEGAEVWALDFRDVPGVSRFIRVNLAKKDEIDLAISQLPPKIDKFFSNAATPGIFYGNDRFTTAEAFAVNYGASRYLVEAVAPRMPAGSSISMTSSCVAVNWRDRVELYDELYTKYPEYEACKEWAMKYIGTLGEPGILFPEQYVYGVSKEAITYFAERTCFDLLKRGIRLNVLSPGAIDTAMTPDFGIISEHFGDTEFSNSKAAVNPIIGRASTAREQALCLLFLSSDMSVALSGCDLASDYGFNNAVFFNRCTANGELI